MTIVVVSDTHLPRFRANFERALPFVVRERPDLILHCGDLTTLDATAALERIAPVEAVAGNNDGDDIVRRYGRKKIVEAGSARLGMIHGDGTRGTTPGRARAAFEDDVVDGIVFGHSHIPLLEAHDERWLLNPGSLTDRRRQPRCSYAVVETASRGIVEPRIVFFDIDA